MENLNIKTKTPKENFLAIVLNLNVQTSETQALQIIKEKNCNPYINWEPSSNSINIVSFDTLKHRNNSGTYFVIDTGQIFSNNEKIITLNSTNCSIEGQTYQAELKDYSFNDATQKFLKKVETDKNGNLRSLQYTLKDVTTDAASVALIQNIKKGEALTGDKHWAVLCLANYLPFNFQISEQHKQSIKKNGFKDFVIKELFKKQFRGQFKQIYKQL